jgi:hypothetical protein
MVSNAIATMLMHKPMVSRRWDTDSGPVLVSGGVSTTVTQTLHHLKHTSSQQDLRR